MAQRLHSINAPALLRALADVLEQHPHAYPQLAWSYSTQVEDEWLFPTRKANRPAAVDASFSARIGIGQPALNLAMSAAYKRHGGNPSAFLTEPELAQLEVAS